MGGLESLVKHLSRQEGRRTKLPLNEIESMFGGEIAKTVSESALSDEPICCKSYDIRVSCDEEPSSDPRTKMYELSLHKKEFNWLPQAFNPLSRYPGQRI